MKRKIFLILSILIWILPAAMWSLIILPAEEPSVFNPTGLKIFLFIISHIVFFALMFIIQVVLASRDSPNRILSPLFGLYSLRMKKSFHSELGEFYLNLKQNKSTPRLYIEAEVVVYEQKYFYMIEKFEMKYDGDIDSFKNRLKMRLEDTYRSELREINKRKELKNKWKNWSGAVDKQSEREMKLNSILNSNS